MLSRILQNPLLSPRSISSQLTRAYISSKTEKTDEILPVLGYWNIRGLAQPIRLLLEYTGTKYHEKRYYCGPPPDYERNEWLNDKSSLGLAFPNLPYYIDADVKLTHSQVILRYLARKYNLAGDNETEVTRADMIAAQLQDFIIDYKALVFSRDFLNRKKKYMQTLPSKLELLKDFLGAKKFVLGKNVSYADFMLFEFLESQGLLNESLLDNFPSLNNFQKNVVKLESVENYLNSSKAIKYPFNGAPASIGGPYSDSMLRR